MRYSLIFGLFLILNSSRALTQTSKFDSLANEMFFNIFINKPDACVWGFVKRYFPAFTEPPKRGGWTIYPPGTPPKLEYTVHSLKFLKHPHFDTKFREGRLDVFASEQEGVTNAGVTDFQLWFMFDSKADAQTAFSKLCGKFNEFSKNKRTATRNGKMIAEYSAQEVFDEFNSVQLILTGDELQDNKYKLFFRIGSLTYKK